jgi:hypothetical protein
VRRGLLIGRRRPWRACPRFGSGEIPGGSRGGALRDGAEEGDDGVGPPVSGRGACDAGRALASGVTRGRADVRGPVAGAGRVRPGRARARGRWAAAGPNGGGSGELGRPGEREREETDRAGLTWAGFGFWLVLGFSFLFLLLF